MMSTTEIKPKAGKRFLIQVVVVVSLGAAYWCLGERGQREGHHKPDPSAPDKTSAENEIAPLRHIRQPRIPCGPAANTAQKQLALEQAWYDRVWAEQYQRFGTHSTNWDGLAGRFLPEYGKFRVDPGNLATSNSLLRLAEELARQKCVDPLLVYMCGNAWSQLRDAATAEPMVRQGLTLLEQSSYPRLHLYFAARRLHKIGKDTNSLGAEELAALNRKKLTYLGQAAADPDFTNGNQRIYLREFLPEVGISGGQRDDQVALAIHEMTNNPHTDPWIRAMAKGIWHVKRAWQVRGSGYANTVTPEGWQGFEQELKAAHQELITAYALHPEFPEAAAVLIEVSMATDQSQMTAWFQRAVAAQLDYMFAYNQARWGLRPRWGGSHAQMHQMGVACLETQRFDTQVPWEYVRAVLEIGSERDDWRDACRQFCSVAELQLLFSGYEAAATNASAYYQSGHAIMAWAAGHYDVAAQLLGRLSNSLDRAAVDYYTVYPRDIIADVRLRTSASQEEFAAAETQFRQDQSVTLLPCYRGLLQQVTNDAVVTSFLNDRLATLAFRQSMAAGRGVAVVPGKDLYGWRMEGGQWERMDNGALVGRSGQDGLLLQWLPLLGSKFEISGEVEANFRAGLMIGGNTWDAQNVYLDIDPCGNQVCLYNYATMKTSVKTKTPLGKRNRFCVRVNDGTYTVAINEETVITNLVSEAGTLPPRPLRLRLGGQYWQTPGYSAKFHTLSIRPLPGAL